GAGAGRSLAGYRARAGPNPTGRAPAFALDSARPGARIATKTAPANSTAAPTSSARLIPCTKAAFAWVTRSGTPRRCPIAWAAPSEPRAFADSAGESEEV